MDAVELSLFAHRVADVCEEMAATLKRSAFSTNIRDRLDYSCAVFDARGVLVGQSAAIPVHLGAMAYAMTSVLDALAGDAIRAPAPVAQLIYNDPACGGTHLPDVTVIMPIMQDDVVIAWAANRAHHADIGATAPGSMPISESLDDEGICIGPTWMTLDGPELEAILQRLTHPVLARGDFAAQFAANRAAGRRLGEITRRLGRPSFESACAALNAYGEQLARATIADIPDGCYAARDVLDDDGYGTTDIPIELELTVAGDSLTCDFTATADSVRGNVNCPRAVTAAAVFFVLRCLMPSHTPGCGGCMRPVRLSLRHGSLLDPPAGCAVAAGNVETSTRVVDVVCRALAQALPDQVPAAAQGTMNNIAMGHRGAWNYYETIAGGHGGSAQGPGASARQSHMTNTLNTPIEVLEREFPLRLRSYALRSGSGGAGRHHGGDGLVREFEFLAEAEVSLITERRRSPPWGLAGGADGQPGKNLFNAAALPPKVSLTAKVGDVLRIETPGGGGWGEAETGAAATKPVT